MDAVDGFSVRIEDEGLGPVLWVGGELDIATAATLRSHLEGLGDEKVLLDLSEVTFMDSSGISVLIWKHHNGGVTLRGVQPAQMEVLEITGLIEVFDFDLG
jgi:anti-anti-sigma factor